MEIYNARKYINKLIGLFGGYLCGKGRGLPEVDRIVPEIRYTQLSQECGSGQNFHPKIGVIVSST